MINEKITKKRNIRRTFRRIKELKQLGAEGEVRINCQTGEIDKFYNKHKFIEKKICSKCGNKEEGFYDNNRDFICKGCIIETSKELSNLKKIVKFDFQIT